MFNLNDINLAQARYQELVRDVERAALEKRSRAGMRYTNRSQGIAWKTQLQNIFRPVVGRKNALQRTR